MSPTAYSLFQAAAPSDPVIEQTWASIVLPLLALGCGVVVVLIVGTAAWLLFRIMYRAAYPPEPKACPHCGKPLA